jgi:hypothetical protein
MDAVFKSIYAVLQDDHTGLFPLALAMLRPKLTKTEASKLTESLKLPTIDGLSEYQVRSAFIDLWLWQAMRKHAIKLQHTPENVVGAGGSSGIREWNGKFSKKVTALLEARGLKQWLKDDCQDLRASNDVFARAPPVPTICKRRRFNSMLLIWRSGSAANVPAFRAQPTTRRQVRFARATRAEIDPANDGVSRPQRPLSYAVGEA